MTVALVSCVKSKGDAAAAAKDLYVSPLFRGLRAYAEAHSDEWYILSAEHGLLEPDRVIEPYERTLNNMNARDRKNWAVRVQQQLSDVLPPNADIVILAGERYREHLVPFLERHGHRVSIPLAGLSLGRQLQFLMQQ